MSKWTTRSRASVITSSIEITVLMKEQLDAAIKWCIGRDIDFSWETISGDSIEPSKYILTIDCLPWAHNLTILATILEASDYGSDDEDKHA
jgi:hypothetical protein